MAHEQAFSIGKTLFVGGLHWQILTGKPTDAKREIRQLGRHLTFDLAVHRKTGVPQVGLAATAEGFASRMNSAAAIVSKSIEIEFNKRDFLCATKLPDGRFLYVAQSEGVILANGDTVSDEDSVRQRLFDDMSIGKDWELIIAPDHWQISKSQSKSFEEFIPRKNHKLDLRHAWWQLSPVDLSIPDYLRKHSLLVVILGVAIGLWYGYTKLERMLATRAILQQIAISNAQVTPAPQPWKQKPSAESFYSGCVEALSQVPTFWPGNWLPISATCDATSQRLSVTWKRGEFGWARHLLEVVPNASISADGEIGTLSVPLLLANQVRDVPLAAAFQRKRLMSNLAQELNVPLSLTAVPAAPPKPNEAAPTWSEYRWQLRTGHVPPESILSAFYGPGFYISTLSVAFDKGQMSWEIGGSQYVN